MELLNDYDIDKFFGTYERVTRSHGPKGNMYYRRRCMMGVKKDCFAYRIGRCSVLTEMVCRRDTCSFYKTKEQAEEDRKRYGYIKNYKQKGEHLAALYSEEES